MGIMRAIASFLARRGRKKGRSKEPGSTSGSAPAFYSIGPESFSLGDRPIGHTEENGKEAGQGQGEGKGEGAEGGKEGQKEDGQPKKESDISPRLEENLKWLKGLFHVEKNSDIIIREFFLATDPPRKAALIFVEGLIDKKVIDLAVLQPLMLLAGLDKDAKPEGPGVEGPIEMVLKHLVPGTQVEKKATFAEVIDGMLKGASLLLVDGANSALLVETKGWEHRTVEKPTTEQTVKGPHEAFNEVVRVNTALIRRRIRSPHLIMEALKVGKLSSTDVVVAYIEGLTNPKLVEEIKRRIKAVETDFIPDSGYVEQYLEDAPFSPFPQFLSTERPDRVAAGLTEGQVAILTDGSPYTTMVPSTFTIFLQSSEDYYLRWPYSSLLRAIRLGALLIGVFLPAIYIAITTYHQEMIPTGLLLAIAASREKVPFPVLFEAVIMELSLELIREAGLRIPSAIGPTIGIVGALILGQAAVQANIVSPILVIIVAVTALGSFTAPNFLASFSLRFLRFPMMFLAGFLGLYGVAAGTMFLVLHMTALKSFGVPFLSPIAPYRPAAGGDIILRAPLWLMEKRPSMYRPLDRRRQAPYVRTWIPTVEEAAEKVAETEDKEAMESKKDWQGSDPTEKDPGKGKADPGNKSDPGKGKGGAG
ncbi:MAG: spore germination protein [Firmicutes bacterium]|nr:spore germination protein [Bacillota bacterium]